MQYFLSQRKTGSVKKFDRITGTGLSSDRGYCRKPSEVTANIRLEVRFHEGIILLLYAQNTFFKSCDGSSLYAPLCAKEWRQAEDPEQGNPYPAGRIFEQQSGFFWKLLYFRALQYSSYTVSGRGKGDCQDRTGIFGICR